MSDPQTINKPATFADDVIQFAIMKVATNMAIAALDTAEPTFALPVIKQLTDEAIMLLAHAISKQLQLFTTYIIIDAQVIGEDENYGKAEQELRAACASGDAERITKASGAYDVALASVVHNDGSAVPK